MLVCFPVAFLLLPVGIVLGLVLTEALSLYIFFVMIASVVIVQYDNGRLIDEYTEELGFGTVGIFAALFANGILRIAMGSRSLQQFIQQETAI